MAEEAASRKWSLKKKFGMAALGAGSPFFIGPDKMKSPRYHRKTRYSGQPSILVQSSRLNPPVYPNQRVHQSDACAGPIDPLRAEKVTKSV